MKKSSLLTVLLTLALLATLLVAPMGTAFAGATDAPAIPPQIAPITYPGVAGNTFYVIHTNDTHGRLTGSLESSDAGAFSSAKLAGYVENMKALGHDVLLLDAGDAVHGKVSANAFRGYSVINMMNRMGYDAMTLGNHEFDYGTDRIIQLAKYAKFPVLSANFADKEGNLVFEDMTVKQVGDFKVGIFGLTTPETLVKANPKFFAGYQFLDAIETAKSCVAALREQGCDYIIALGHIGMDEESPVTSFDITDEVAGIDLFIDGHSHTLLKEGKRNNGALIVSTGEYLQNVGVVKVTVLPTRSEESAFLLNSSDSAKYDSIPEQRGVKRLLNAYLSYVEELSAQVVGTTDERLEGDREFVRKQQTNLGSLITDAMRINAEADIAITNGGGIRATLEIGDITYNDVLTVLPFGNYVVVKNMTGAEVLAVLEESVANYPNLAGGYMHVSGIAFSFDASAAAGSRIDPADVTVGGAPLGLEKSYLVATNDFLAAGGDGSSLGKGSIAAEYGPLDQVLLEYMQEYGCVYEPGDRVTAIE